MLDFAPGPDGSLPAHAVARYKQFGDWIRQCYGKAVASTSGSGVTYTALLPPDVMVDRAVIQEDQTSGEHVRLYEISAMVGGKWVQMSSGSSVGNKRIDVWARAVAATQVRLTITNFVGRPQIAFFGVYSPSSC